MIVLSHLTDCSFSSPCNHTGNCYDVPGYAVYPEKDVWGSDMTATLPWVGPIFQDQAATNCDATPGCVGFT